MGKPDAELTPFARRLLVRSYEFEIEDGVLLRCHNRNGVLCKQVVVPRVMLNEILRAFHDDPTGAHLSKDRMLGKIRERYFWLNQTRDVKRHCKTCLACQKLKPPHANPVAPLQPIECSRPFEYVSMDVCGPYPVSERRNKYVLVITDHFTKWVEAYPIPDQEAPTIAARFEQFVNQFGYPDVVLTDQGRNFESSLLKEMCVRLKIDKRTTSAYHPQCNGQTERFNRTMNQMLAQYVSENQTDWDLWLGSVLYAYRTAKHSSTGYSPFELVFGRVAKQPVDFLIPAPKSETPRVSPQRYFSALRDTLEAAREDASKHLRHAQASQKKYYDQSANAPRFSIGDYVLVKDPVARGFPKFRKNYRGPFVVVSKPIAGGVTYILRSVADGKILHVHRNNLKICNMPESDQQSFEVLLGVGGQPPGVLDAGAPAPAPSPPACARTSGGRRSWCASRPSCTSPGAVAGSCCCRCRCAIGRRSGGFQPSSGPAPCGSCGAKTRSGRSGSSCGSTAGRGGCPSEAECETTRSTRGFVHAFTV